MIVAHQVFDLLWLFPYQHSLRASPQQNLSMIQLMMLTPRTRSRRKRRPADKAAQRRRDEVAKLRTQGL